MTVTVDDLPPSIRVGPYDIAITLLDKLDKDSHGAFCLEQQEIQLRNTAPSPHFAADTFLHELIHASWRTMGLPDRCAEEWAASALATCLIQVFRDKPELLLWMHKKLT